VRTGLEPATHGVTGRYSNQTELPHQNMVKKIKKNAVRTGLEPATLGVTGRYSNQTELPHHFFNQNLNEITFLKGVANIYFLFFPAIQILFFLYRQQNAKKQPLMLFLFFNMN
jgi:hypothetical protein